MEKVKEYFGFLRLRKPRDYFTVGGFDVTFLALVIILLAIGIVMMFSASYVNALYDSSEEVGNDPYYYFKKQIVFAAVGLVAMFVVSHIRYDVFKDFSLFAAIVSIILLILVLIFPHEIEGKEEFKRWLAIPGVTTFQPSEVAKLGVIMFLAWSMERHRKFIEKNIFSIFPYLGALAIFCVLVLLENHVSGTILIFGIGIAMTFFGGCHKLWYILGVGAVVVIGFFLIVNRDSGFMPNYVKDRLDAWLDEDYDPTGSRWQINQSLYAIGSGGLFGLGFGNSKQKHLYLPEPQNDFVFSVVCEELGFIRSLIIMLLFVLLVARGFVIALRAKSRYATLLVLGICVQVGLQAGLNVAVVTGTVPNTGISLPFFSSGGTSLMMLLAQMGMVLSVSRDSSGFNKKSKNKSIEGEQDVR